MLTMQHIGRIKKAIDRWGQHFLNRVYTRLELELYYKNPSSLAARFSGKEAVIKTLNSRSIGLKEIEILSDFSGKPQVKLYGKAQLQAEDLGLTNIDVSLSHCHEYAAACAIGETKN
jgi:phosphopantetheine--protein transferase-like protein